VNVDASRRADARLVVSVHGPGDAGPAGGAAAAAPGWYSTVVEPRIVGTVWRKNATYTAASARTTTAPAACGHPLNDLVECPRDLFPMPVLEVGVAPDEPLLHRAAVDLLLEGIRQLLLRAVRPLDDGRNVLTVENLDGHRFWTYR
jgi:hypothetical protein